TLSGGSVLAIVSDKNNPVYLYIKNKLAAGGGSFTNSPTNDLGLFILYSGTSSGDFSGVSATGAIIYTPNSKLVLSGGSGVYGAIIANELDDSGGSPVCYDRALKNSLVRLSS